MNANFPRNFSYLIATGALCASMAGCHRAEKAPEPVRPALAYKVGTNAGMDSDVYPGEIRARHEADHAFRIGGKMVSRLVEQGTVVKQGQPLARLDPQDVKLAADAATANVNAAATEATFADAEYQRYRDLFSKGFVSQSALDQKLNVANAAKARLESARAQASVSFNQAAYSTLVAEQDGVVTQVIAESGQVVAQGQPVLRIANPAEKELSISVPEGKIAEFRNIGAKGATPKQLRVATWSQPGKYYLARVREVGAAADAVTRTYPVRITLTDADEGVQLGMSAYAVFLGANESGVMSVPLSAILVKGDAAGVWKIADDGKVSLKPVTVVQYKENAALIKGGVSVGETIVAAGVHKLREGDVVRPVLDPLVTGAGKVAEAPTEPLQAAPKVARNIFGL